MKLKCKQCGNSEEVKNLQECENFILTQESDPLQPTVCTCNTCGTNGIVDNFLLNDTKLSSSSVGGKTQDASDASESVSTTETRNVEKRYRKNPEKRIHHKNPEQVRGTVAMANPFVKKAQFEDLESPNQAVKDGKVVAVWVHPKNPKKMFKDTTGGAGMQFTEDGGKTWEFSMRTPEEIDRQGYIRKKGPEVDDTEEREQMGFDNEEEWQDMKDSFASNNPFVKKAYFPFEPDIYPDSYNDPFLSRMYTAFQGIIHGQTSMKERLKKQKLQALLGEVQSYYEALMSEGQERDLHFPDGFDMESDDAKIDATVKEALELERYMEEEIHSRYPEGEKIVDEDVEKSKYLRDMLGSSNPFLKRATSDKNPFVKVAREFKRSPWGQFMKNLSEDNMSFPEDPPGKGKNSPKSKGSGKSGKEGAGDPYGETAGMSTKDSEDDEFSTYDFNPVDRKEYRSSPKRRDIEPGAAEWEDKEVDKYYDGWVADHIENSGGKVIGSNTPAENIMNLDDGQREKDLGNRDMIYERLLEGRHNFNDDYTFVEVADQQYKISKEAARKIVASKMAGDDETFISKAALDLILKKAGSDCGCGCGGSGKCKEANSKKKTLNKKASKYPLLSIPI